MECGVAGGGVEGEGVVATAAEDGGPVGIAGGVDGVITGAHVGDVIAADASEGVVASPGVDGVSQIGVGDELITRGAAGDRGEGGGHRRCWTGSIVWARSFMDLLLNPL